MSVLPWKTVPQQRCQHRLRWHGRPPQGPGAPQEVCEPSVHARGWHHHAIQLSYRPLEECNKSHRPYRRRAEPVRLGDETASDHPVARRGGRRETVPLLRLELGELVLGFRTRVASRRKAGRVVAFELTNRDNLAPLADLSVHPHSAEFFKHASDPQFVHEVKDVVGRSLDPPERAVVLGADENSPSQALTSTPLSPAGNGGRREARASRGVNSTGRALVRGPAGDARDSP